MAPWQGTLYKNNILLEILASVWREEKPVNRHSKEKQMFIPQPCPADFYTPPIPFITAEDTMPPNGEGMSAFNFIRETFPKRSELSPFRKMTDTAACSLWNISNMMLE